MKTKQLLTLVFTLYLSVGLAAHHDGDHAVVLNLDGTYKECSMMLSPAVTQNEFKDFGREVGPILFFKPVAGAKPLGKFNFDIGIEQQRTSPLEDYKGKWNNTFVHPTSDHYLVGDSHSLVIPLLHARMGISERTDIEAYFTKNFGANYGFAGGAIKYAFYHDAESNWAASSRLTYSALFGVNDFNYHQGGVDVLVSKDLWFFRPYAGAGITLGQLTPTTTKVNLAGETLVAPLAIVGLQFVYKHLSLAAEADFGVINMYTLRVAAAF